MKLLKNQSVKILFRNGTAAEGIVESWDEQSGYVLMSQDSKSMLVVQDPKQDIMAVKIILEEKHVEIGTNALTDPYVPSYGGNTAIGMNAEDVNSIIVDNNIESSSNEILRLKKIAELKKLANQEERQAIANKLRTHHIGEVKHTNYELPSFLNIKK